MNHQWSSTTIARVASNHWRRAAAAALVVMIVVVLIQFGRDTAPESESERDVRATRISRVEPYPESALAVELPWPRRVNRDPFHRPTEVEPEPSRPTLVEEAKPQAEPALRLGSILYSATPRALINGVVVRIGDRIDGFEVVGIDRRSVTLLKDGKKRVLYL